MCLDLLPHQVRQYFCKDCAPTNATGHRVCKLTVLRRKDVRRLGSWMVPVKHLQTTRSGKASMTSIGSQSTRAGVGQTSIHLLLDVACGRPCHMRQWRSRWSGHLVRNWPSHYPHSYPRKRCCRSTQCLERERTALLMSCSQRRCNCRLLPLEARRTSMETSTALRSPLMSCRDGVRLAVRSAASRSSPLCRAACRAEQQQRLPRWTSTRSWELSISSWISRLLGAGFWELSISNWRHLALQLLPSVLMRAISSREVVLSLTLPAL
mmetsp:Transcript_20758/g.37022  ORF Transcript_20758/g.37022 Transcript_20758/m.37022 type:complete len:266 (-) Transcript_20758:330-1127(-)